MQDLETRDAYSKDELAARLGIGYMTVHRLLKTGKIKSVKVGRRVLIPRTELERLLTSPPDQRAA